MTDLINNCSLAGALGLTNCSLLSNILLSCQQNSGHDMSQGGSSTIRSHEDTLILIFYLNWFSHSEVTNDFNGLSGNYYWVGGIKEKRFFLQGTHGLTGNKCQKLWDYTDQNIIHAVLQWNQHLKHTLPLL